MRKSERIFTLKGGSTSHLGFLPSGKKRKPLLLVARNHFILRLADHQRSTPAAVFCAGMNPLSLKDLVAECLPDACLLMLAAHSMLARCSMLGDYLGLGIAAMGYLANFSVSMFLRKRVLPRM